MRSPLRDGKQRANHKRSKPDRTPESASSMCASLMAQPSSLCSRPLKQSIVVNSVLRAMLRAERPHRRESPRGNVLVNDAAFHDENNAAHRGDVFDRIAVERNDVGFVTWRDGADMIAHAHRFGGERVG